jgi:hypothetical protein
MCQVKAKVKGKVPPPWPPYGGVKVRVKVWPPYGGVKVKGALPYLPIQPLRQK